MDISGQSAEKGRDALSEGERESCRGERKMMSGAARTEAGRRGRYQFVGTRRQSAPYLFLMRNVKLPLKPFYTFLPKSPGEIWESAS